MKLEDFYKGWLVGNFEPSIIKTKDLDLGILYLKAGECGDGHFHKEHTEYNMVVSGSALIEDKTYNVGDFFIYKPKEKSYVQYPEDTILLVIKTPATKNDKHY